MPDPGVSGFGKRIDGLLDVHAQTVHQIAHNKITSPVESVVAVDADVVLVPPFGLGPDLLVLTNSVNLQSHDQLGISLEGYTNS